VKKRENHSIQLKDELSMSLFWDTLGKVSNIVKMKTVN